MGRHHRTRSAPARPDGSAPRRLRARGTSLRHAVPIPSYDDLTPSIPDVLKNDVLSSVAAVLSRRGAEAPRPTPDVVAPGSSTFAKATADKSDPGVDATAPRELYAALHDAAGTSLDRLLTIARDFSPRIECHPGGTVVLDIAGLQRLFGGAASIGEHLARAGAARVGIAATQTTAVLLARTCEGVRIGADPGTALRDV